MAEIAAIAADDFGWIASGCEWRWIDAEGIGWLRWIRVAVDRCEKHWMAAMDTSSGGSMLKALDGCDGYE